MHQTQGSNIYTARDPKPPKLTTKKLGTKNSEVGVDKNYLVLDNINTGKKFRHSHYLQQ